jgi:hypothetical protein
VFVSMSPALKKKLFQDKPINQIMLYSDTIEASNVGDNYAPLVKMIPFNRNKEHPIPITFQHVQYKRLLRTTELNHLHFKVCDDAGHLIDFVGTISLTLHIRNASNENTLL